MKKKGIILSLIFTYSVLCIYNNGKLKKIAGFLAGLMLTFVHLLGTNLTYTSVNPFRSFGPALFKCGDAIKKVWVFLVFPLVGGAVAGILYKLFGSKGSSSNDNFKNALQNLWCKTVHNVPYKELKSVLGKLKQHKTNYKHLQKIYWLMSLYNKYCEESNQQEYKLLIPIDDKMSILSIENNCCYD